MKDAATGHARVAELDGLRGAAVLVIVFLHYVVHHMQVLPGSPLAYAQKSLMFLWIGVDAFFVLSGFLIGGILMDQRHTPNYFQVFYLRRSLRIFPAYLLLVFLWLAVRNTMTMHEAKWLLEPAFPAWPYFVYGQNIWMALSQSTGPNFVAATWSLAVEEQFYLLFPLVVRWTSPKALAALLLVGIASAPMLRVLFSLLGPGWDHAQTLLLPSRWDSLLIGALVAWAIRNERISTWLALHRRALMRAFILLTALMCAWPLLINIADPRALPWRAAFMHLSIALFFGSMLFLIRSGWLPSIALVLSGSWLRFFGRISYFLYLFHTAILGMSFAIILEKDPMLNDWTDGAVVLGAFGITIALACVSWRWIEAPLIKRGHQHSYVAPSSASTGRPA